MKVAQVVPLVLVRAFAIKRTNIGNQSVRIWRLFCNMWAQYHFVNQILGNAEYSFSGMNSTGLLMEYRFLKEGIWSTYAAFCNDRRKAA